ncbi:MAG: hypothetical protein Kow00122_16280 [Thermoleophilia bacterium]
MAPTSPAKRRKASRMSPEGAVQADTGASSPDEPGAATDPSVVGTVTAVSAVTAGAGGDDVPGGSAAPPHPLAPVSAITAAPPMTIRPLPKMWCKAPPFPRLSLLPAPRG